MDLLKTKLELLQGRISNVSSGFETFGRSDRGSGAVHTNTWTFRIGHKPVSFKTKQNMNFSDGDIVTIVGGEKNGIFHVTCLRNETTGSVFEPTITLAYIIGGCFILLGLLLLVIFIGFILIPIGLFFIWSAYNGSRAVNLLRTTPTFAAE